MKTCPFLRNPGEVERRASRCSLPKKKGLASQLWSRPPGKRTPLEAELQAELHLTRVQSRPGSAEQRVARIIV